MSIIRRFMGHARRPSQPASPEAPDIGAIARADPLLSSASEADRRIVEGSLRHSLTGVARLLGLIDAVRYCIARDVPGAFAECGVWRGGSVLAMILTLQDASVGNRDIYLFDTFEGMTAPTRLDTSAYHPPALDEWREARDAGGRAYPELFGSDVFDEESVRSLLLDTGYPADRLHFVKGPVEETLPAGAPDEIALLRLDTDWYESTRHEMVHLFPRISSRGVLIVDDYGHWEGAKRAVDEYFVAHHPPLLMSRLDYACRIAVKH